MKVVCTQIPVYVIEVMLYIALCLCNVYASTGTHWSLAKMTNSPITPSSTYLTTG